MQHSNIQKIVSCLADDEFKKQRYYNISCYVWKMKKKKKKKNEMPTLIWEIIRTTASYTKITAEFDLFF